MVGRHYGGWREITDWSRSWWRSSKGRNDCYRDSQNRFMISNSVSKDLTFRLIIGLWRAERFLSQSKDEKTDGVWKQGRVCVRFIACVWADLNPVTVKFDCTVVNSHRATRHSLCVRPPSTHTHTPWFAACHLVNIRFFIDLWLSWRLMASSQSDNKFMGSIKDWRLFRRWITRWWKDADVYVCVHPLHTVCILLHNNGWGITTVNTLYCFCSVRKCVVSSVLNTKVALTISEVHTKTTTHSGLAAFLCFTWY